MNKRRFPAPWRAERVEGGYVVRDASGFRLSYVYAPSNYADLGTAAAGHLSPDEARRIATAIARLPELLAAEKKGAGCPTPVDLLEGRRVPSNLEGHVSKATGNGGQKNV